MATPRKRKSHSRVRMRRSHDALKPVHLTACQRCQAPRRPHTICTECGFYRGNTWIKIEEKEFE